MIKSEAFQQSYCIFISYINDAIEEKIKSYGINSIKLLKASFKDGLYCIVIPEHLTYRVYAGELFNLYTEVLPASGFWGQSSMGYKGKEWEVII
jgi:hypothetical protein